MHPVTLVKLVVATLVLALFLGVGWFTRTTWKGWLIAPKDDTTAQDEHQDPERVKLSEQARKNLRLDKDNVKQITLGTYWRRITIPGAVIDRPGHSDRGIPAPVSGRVIEVYAVPGKTFRAGDDLFRIRVVSESFQSSQMELFKNVCELEIAQKEYKRLKGFSETVVPQARLIELEYAQLRSKALIHAYRQDLRARQLATEQIDKIEKGDFVTELTIRMPMRLAHQPHSEEHSSAKDKNVEYAVQELKINLNDYVQAGQILAYVADHRFLYIEGRALKQEVRLLTNVMKDPSLPVEAEFASDEENGISERLTGLHIEFLGNTMDATGLTLPVYVPFRNPSLDYERQGKMHHAGMYRPGQKVLLKVAVAKMTGVFVLPVAAVAREGPEAYVFKQSGDSFIRRAVHVVAEDADEVAIANDRSILEGQMIAHTAAAALNRVLKASQAEGAGGGHAGHDH